MKKPIPPKTNHRFRGSLYHYHRTFTQRKRAWNAWISGGGDSLPNSFWLSLLSTIGKLIGIGLIAFILFKAIF